MRALAALLHDAPVGWLEFRDAGLAGIDGDALNALSSAKLRTCRYRISDEIDKIDNGR